MVIYFGLFSHKHAYFNKHCTDGPLKHNSRPLNHIVYSTYTGQENLCIQITLPAVRTIGNCFTLDLSHNSIVKPLLKFQTVKVFRPSTVLNTS